MATPQVKDLVLRSPAGSSEVVTFSWPLQIGHGQDKHDNGIDIIDTIKFVCEELPGISSAFEEVNLNNIDTACYKTMTNLVDRFNKAVDSIVALEKGTSLPTERLNKFADPSLLRHILQLVYNAAVSDPDKLNNYEPFSPEVYGETSYELVQQMIKHVTVNQEDTFIDLGSGVGQVVLQMAGSFPLKTCIGIEKADTPVRYAQRMDQFFRQYMAWFGKRFCEYRLLKGDFLVDEHREKITSSTLVFVNNFAFGPNVDHQLKERFADLRDGARIVSSKSFCPLNFRITDRNLSDIGTIMHLSEIPPLKGSVSWTCKPVSYYLHVIDRTILERYFQRMKSHKGPEHNEHVGSTRTTRDRAKREANHQNNNNNNNNNHANSVNNSSNANNNSNSNTPTMNSNSNSNSTGSTAAATTTTATNAQNGKSSTKMDESSTDSEAEAVVAGTAPTTTRRTWSDWCSSKGKSSQSDDEENNNFSSTTNSRNIRAATQKRKKLTRKAAIASKSAAAAAAAQAAAEKIAAAAAQKESGNLAAPNAVGGAKRKGRMKKGGGRGKKNLKIVGLDVLHTQTLLSTSVEMMCKKLPPAPGCVDQQLTSLTGDMSHTELEIPQAPSDTPYALQILLNNIRQQYMAMIDNMKSKSFIANLKRKIQQEQERKQRIKNRASQLDKQIKVLIDDSVALLKARMNELGINMSSPNDLLAKAKEIVGRHKELQGMVKKISSQVTAGEIEQKRLLKKNLHSLPEFAKLSKQKNGTPEAFDISEAAAHDLLLKEIANTLVQRKKLYAQVSTIEKESITLEKVVEERKTAATLLAQGTNLTIATSTAPAPATTSSSTITTTSKSSHTKSSRRSRDHRTRSQEWPDVPDVGKIEESNPEVLAQKILETGRQIEAGKIPSYKHKDERANKHRSSSSEHNTHHHPQFLPHHSGPDSALMPAPPQGGLKQQQQQQIPIVANHVPLTAGGGRANSKSSKNHQESPKVANFEDRLKSIITSALNEDQEHRKSQHPPVEAVAAPPPASPAKKHTSKSSSNNHHHQQTAQQQMHHHHLSNIITVATQGLTHLNSTTTISPITPPLQQHHYGHSAPTQNGPIHHMHHHSQAMPPSAHSGYKSTGSISTNIGTSYSKQSTSSSSISSSTSLPSASGSASSSSSAHHQHHQKYPKSNPTSSSSASSIERAVSIHQLHGHNQHHPAQHQQSSTAHQHAALYAAATDLAFRRGFEHHAHYQEFKAPEIMNRAVGEEPTRSHSASSDSAMYYPPTRDRLLSLDRSQQQQPMQQPSRPSSSSSQPDYTQVSPAKMALRRHLSQEKLANQHVGPPNATGGSVMASKTIGDLVNGEIERTLEISHQSIINAVVNMSAMTVPPPTAAAGSTTTTPSTTERPIINPNAQRPERVHVRVMDEISTQQNHSASSHHQQHHHGHHPYNQISPRTRSDGSISEKKKSPADNLTTLAAVAYNHKMISKQQQQPSSSSSAGRPSNALSYSTSAGYQQHQHSMPLSTGERGTLPHPSPTSSSSSSTTRNSSSSKRDYSTVALPRAEMKPCLESYFNEEPRPAPVAAPLSMKERIPNRRMNGNPPLEGLAVSLQDHVMASRKFKEENEERQRRSEMAAAHFQNSNMANTTSTVPPPLTQHNDRTSPIKVEIGMKRTSPSQAHHPRPSKIPNYASHEHLISGNSNTNSSSCSSSTNNGCRSNSSLEPPLMSPEINSLMADERPLQLSSRPRTTDDDDVIPDDETHWQDRVSSGFDRLVAFASTELDKTRRSIDTDTAPSISCNTSPDSGIAHSSNSEARTFLSTSSSSSQLDIGAHTDPMSDSSTKSSHDVVPISKTSRVDDAIESPPLSDIGLPRTPSPSAVTPPLGSLLFPQKPPPTTVSSESNVTAAGTKSSTSSSSSSSSSTTQPGLKIPLKYQRKSKTSSEKHYKKKFCERNWGFEDEQLYGSGEAGSNECNGVLSGGANNSSTSSHRKDEVSAMHHKASKFRPKGKDWDWSVESKSKGANVTTASSSTVANSIINRNKVPAVLISESQSYYVNNTKFSPYTPTSK